MQNLNRNSCLNQFLGLDMFNVNPYQCHLMTTTPITSVTPIFNSTIAPTTSLVSSNINLRQKKNCDDFISFTNNNTMLMDNILKGENNDSTFMDNVFNGEENDSMFL